MTKGRYAVGYGRPPEKTRFRRGQSGNPKGRPRKERQTFAGILEEELNAELTLIDKGETKSINARKVIVTQLGNLAAKGDTQAFRSLILLRVLAEKYGDKLPVRIRYR